MSNWKALEVKVPGKDYLEDIRTVLETLVLFLDICKTILNTVKAFLTAIGNPIKALVLAIIRLVTALIESLRRTGLYGWFHFPDLIEDPSFKRHAGGFPRFVDRWKGSLLDGQDINRPRPVPGFNTGGFILIVADAQGPAKLLRLVKVLISFFTSNGIPPRYGAPSNLKSFPVGDSKIPMESVSAIFGEKPTGICLKWTPGAPVTTASPNNQFQGLAAELSAEFTPPQWLIERTSILPTDDTESPDTPGRLVKLREVQVSPRSPVKTNQTFPVLDPNGDQHVMMEKAFVVDSTKNTRLYLATLFGYRFLDYDVEPGKTYWYRVRGFSGNLDYNSSTEKINYNTSDIKFDELSGSYTMEYPGTDVIMGVPTGLIEATCPLIPDEFDVIENIRHIFLSGFSLNFHLTLGRVQDKVWDPVAQETVPAVDANGYPIYLPAFDDKGDPIPPYTNGDIGKGTLSAQAGILASLEAVPALSIVANGTGLGSGSKLEDLRAYQRPWTTADVRAQAARLTSTYTGLALEAGSGFLTSFKEFMQGPIPFWPPENPDLVGASSVLKDVRTLEDLVFALTYTEPKPKLSSPPTSEEALTLTKWVAPESTIRTYGSAFDDKAIRKNILATVNFIQALGYQGVPPNWNRLALLQDVLPWSAKMIYEMLAKLQALLDGANDLIAEIQQFVDLLLRKINALENFLQFLIYILNVIEQLSAGFYLLSAYGLDKGIGDWFAALDTAGGDKPKSTVDGGYTAGLCLAYLAPDVTGIKEAFELIF